MCVTLRPRGDHVSQTYLNTRDKGSALVTARTAKQVRGHRRERERFNQKSQNLQDSDIHKQLALFTKASSRTNANHTRTGRVSGSMCLCECVSM